MNTLEKYQADVEAAQKLLERAISSLEEAKKEATAIKLKAPALGQVYYNVSNITGATRTSMDENRYLPTFASTNHVQATAFADALAVMAEMRRQEGIVNPVVVMDNYYTISYTIHASNVEYDIWSISVGTSLFPAYVSDMAARNAVAKVGEQRVIDCIKTMNFMTPESRGEM